MTILSSIIFGIAALSTSVALAATDSQISTQVESGQKDIPRVLVKVNPVYVLLSELSMALEIRAGQFTFGPIGSYSPEHSYGSSDEDDSSSFYTNERYKKYSYGLQGKYYFNQLNKHSAYLGVMAQYLDITVKMDQGSTTYSGRQDFIEVGAIVGYQWVFPTNFLVNVGGGIKNSDAQGKFQFRSSNGDSIDRDAFGNTLAGIILDIGLGYKF